MVYICEYKAFDAFSLHVYVSMAMQHIHGNTKTHIHQYEAPYTRFYNQVKSLALIPTISLAASLATHLWAKDDT